MNGSNNERDVVKWFRDEYDYAVRMPGSGTEDVELPDVLGTHKGVAFGIECKSTSSDYASFKVREAQDLLVFCQQWPAIPVFSARFSYDTNQYAITHKDMDDFGYMDKNSFSLSRNHTDGYNSLQDIVEMHSTHACKEGWGVEEVREFVSSQS